MAINESQLALLKIQLKRATSSEWNRTTDTGGAWSGYLLREAELGIEVFPDNTTKIKIGNGIDKWSSLKYVAGESGFFVKSLPDASKALKNNFYILGDKIYYTSDNITWTEVGSSFDSDFNSLVNRPKYNGVTLRGSTNIPKVPQKANDLSYSNTTSKLLSTNTQAAIDEIANKLKSTYTRPLGSNILFGNDSAGNASTFIFSDNKVTNSIAKRTSSGTMKATDPIEDDDLTTKLYVDNLVNPLTTKVTLLESNMSSFTNKVTNLNTRVTDLEKDNTNNKNQISKIKGQVDTNTTNISNLTTKLNTTNNTVNNLSTTVTNLQTKVDNFSLDGVQDIINKEITNRQNNDIISIEGGVGSNNNQIKLTKGDGTTLLGTIPLATNTTNGLISYSDYNQIIENRDAIEELKNQSGGYIGQSFATKADLDKYKIPSTMRNGSSTFVLDDETHDGATTKYYYDGTSFKFAYIIESDPVGIATLNKTGVVLSKNEKGKIYVETDGTMSLVGYDNIITTLGNKANKSDIGVKSDNNYTDTDKSKVDLVSTTGDGNKFLGDDGNYHTINIPDDSAVRDIQVDGKSIINSLTKIVELKKVSITGSYNDLTNKPTSLVQDASYVHTDNNFNNTYKQTLDLIKTTGDGKSVLSNDGTYKKLSDVAFTGSYNDLTNKPTNLVQDVNYVHTDNNFTTALKTKLDNLKTDGEANKINSISLNNTELTIDNKKNVNIDLSSYALKTSVPTKLSQLTNDNNTVTDAKYVHTDSNYTAAEKTKLSKIANGAQANKIEIVKVDGTALVIDSSDKSVNIPLVGYATVDSVDDLTTKVNKNTLNIKSLQMSGLWRGIFATKAALPTNAKTGSSKFIGGTVYVNDFVIIKEDETCKDATGKPCKTRYYATNIAEDGTITWTYFDKEEGSIALATNSSLGLVMGTDYQQIDKTTWGTVSVDGDGKMSVNGLNDLLGQYIPLKGNTISTKITGDLHFDHKTGTTDNVALVWDQGDVHQRILIKDVSGASDVFNFQQSKDSGANYDTLTAITNDGKIKARDGICLHNNSSARMVLGGNGGNGTFTWIDNRDKNDKVLSNITLHDTGVVCIPKSRLALGAYDLTKKLPKTEIDYNDSEQCIEFVFNY